MRVSQLWGVDVAGGTKRLVSEGDVTRPAWSPNGHRIAYARAYIPERPARQHDIWTMRPDGSDARPLTNDIEQDYSPVWSADGRHVYFCSARDGSANVWRIGIDERSGRARGAVEHIRVPSAAVLRISLAANDSQLVYESYDAEANVRRLAFDPVRAEVSGEAVPVTSGPREWEELDVAVDGRIALASIRDHPGLPQGIHIITRDGEAPAPLEATPGSARFPRWSPDGSRIAFYGARTGSSETFVIGSDGTGLRRFTHFGDSGAGFFPQWSPDGSRIVIATAVRFGGTLFVLDADQPWAEQRRDSLPSPPGPTELRYRPWSWSPDGRMLATYSERGAGLAVYSFVTRRWEVLTATGEKPRWLSDSRRLVYVAGDKIFLYDIAARRSQQIFIFSGYSLTAVDAGPGDRSLYFIARRETGDLAMATLR